MRSFWIKSLACQRSRPFKAVTNYPWPLKIPLSNDAEQGFASLFQNRHTFRRRGRSSEKLSDAITLSPARPVVGGLYEPRLFVRWQKLRDEFHEVRFFGPQSTFLTLR